MQPEPIKQTLDVRREIRRCPECGQRFSRDAVFCPYDGARLEAGAMEPLVDPLVGTSVDGRYEVLDLLGEGGMGRVYRVRHRALGRDFAMKVLRRDLSTDGELVSRFLREAKATASVHHPNVVQISDFGALPDGVPYFVMELLVGHTLGQVIKAGGPIPAGRAVRLIKQVANALGAAHAAGVIHRDLKPDNVFLLGGATAAALAAPVGESFDAGRARAMLGDQVESRVVDFGAAKIIGASRVTRTGIVFGTPHYMSPEQASGGPVDHRADVYALGIIMYEMFTGRVPFEADTYMGVLTQHMFVQPIPPSQVSEAARELGALEDLTLRCLEKRPEGRFASMADLVRALDEAFVMREDGSAQVAPSSAPRPSPGSQGARYAMADELEPPTREEARLARGLPGLQGRVRAAMALGAVALVVAATVAVALRGAGAPANGNPGSAPTAITTPTSASIPTAIATATPTPIPALAPAPSVVSPPVETASAVRSPPPAAAPASTENAGAGGRPVTKRPPPRPAAPMTIDDVGDPFAARK
jgi:serine/threonine-protein kinase